jgi:phage terminase small subunit
MRAQRALTSSQQAFLDRLLINGGNATDAYRHAYPSSRNSSNVSAPAARLRHHPVIVAAMSQASIVSLVAVQAAVDRYQITAERVAEELACLAMTRMSQVADVRTETGTDGKRHQRIVVRDFADADPMALAAISEVKRTPGGELSIKLYDKRAALMDIARLKGYIKDVPPPSGNVVMFKVER